jgi:erythromycin esterase
MTATLEWIRAFNQDHPNDPLRIFGVKPVQAQPADYDAVLDHVRRSAPERLAEVASHLEPIRTTHHTDEHVQRARGTHQGRSFVDHARDAIEHLAVASLADAFDVLIHIRQVSPVRWLP